MERLKHPAVILFVLTAVVYSLVAWDRIAEPSPHFHFVDLAHSFMDGRLDTDTPKQHKASRPKPEDPQGYREAIKRTLDGGGWNDWASIREIKLKRPVIAEDGAELSVLRGKFPWPGDKGDKKNTFHSTDGYELQIIPHRDLARDCGENKRSLCNTVVQYISFPPAPAVVMLPFAAVWGYDTNDVIITILFAALNAALLFLLLQLLVARGHSERSVRDNIWFTVLFAFGTVAFFSSVQGAVWFTALVFGVTFNLIYCMAALDARHPILAGLMLGVGMATRTPIAFCVAFFAWQLFFPKNTWDRERIVEILKKGTMFAAPVLAIGIALMVYNNARFGSPMEFGHSYLSGGAADRIRDHGMFSTYYLNLNLSSALVHMPRISTVDPFITISKHGLGLLFATPVLFLLLRPATKRKLMLACWVTVGCAAVPGLLYQNSGWEQFSYRFALDYFPYLMMLLALGGRPITGKVKALIVFSIIVNLFGAITFGRMPEFYY